MFSRDAQPRIVSLAPGAAASSGASELSVHRQQRPCGDLVVQAPMAVAGRVRVELVCVY